jgi:acyl-CoA synthetase (AMP-forming)/AMP-acid ligase II
MPTLAAILNNHFVAGPERVAVYLQRAGMDDLPVSWERLISHACAYADVFARKGIQPGEVVVLILEHGEDLMYSFFGAILHGTVPSIMPFLTEKLSPERYRADLASLISVTQPAAIITYPEFEPEVRTAVGQGTSVRVVILTNEIAGPLVPNFSALPGMNRPPESVTLLQHSSGTTGLQKGVALSHIAVLNQLQAYSAAIRLKADDVVVSWLPLYHDMGLIAGFLNPVLSGIPLVLMSPFDWVRAPQRLFQSVSQYRGTLTWLPNFAYQFCAQKIRERHMENVDLSSWRAVINCSEPVRWESHQQFFEKFALYGLKPGVLQTCYAMAENVFGVTQSDLAAEPAFDDIDQEAFLHEHAARSAAADRPAMRMLSSGRPIQNTEVRILDDKGHVLPERAIGEISLRSNAMLTGYYHRPDLTEKAFVDGGWYMTGDYGYFADGELYVTGRKKDMIIIGGKNIYPQDVESLVNQVPGVHAGRAVAFGIFDETLGTEEVVVVAEADAHSPDDLRTIADEIRRYITQNTAIALRLVHLVGPQWLLKTSSGKIARAANREKYLAEANGH